MSLTTFRARSAEHERRQRAVGGPPALERLPAVLRVDREFLEHRDRLVRRPQGRDRDRDDLDPGAGPVEGVLHALPQRRGERRAGRGEHLVEGKRGERLGDHAKRDLLERLLPHVQGRAASPDVVAEAEELDEPVLLDPVAEKDVGVDQGELVGHRDVVDRAGRADRRILDHGRVLVGHQPIHRPGDLRRQRTGGDEEQRVVALLVRVPEEDLASFAGRAVDRDLADPPGVHRLDGPNGRHLKKTVPC